MVKKLSYNTKYRDVEIIKYYKDGHSINEVAKEYNMSMSGIYAFLNRSDVKMRSAKEAIKLHWVNKKRNVKYLTRFRSRIANKKPILLVIDGVSILEHHKAWLDYNNLTTIPKDCIIHHIDHNQSNNNIDNLMLMYEKDHKRLHGRNLI